MRLNEGENGSRLVMRAKGNFRLMLNAALFKGQKFQLMEGGKGVSFTCVNAASGAAAKMSTFASEDARGGIKRAVSGGELSRSREESD